MSKIWRPISYRHIYVSLVHVQLTHFETDPLMNLTHHGLVGRLVQINLAHSSSETGPVQYMKLIHLELTGNKMQALRHLSRLRSHETDPLKLVHLKRSGPESAPNVKLIHFL